MHTAPENLPLSDMETLPVEDSTCRRPPLVVIGTLGAITVWHVDLFRKIYLVDSKTGV